MDSSGLQRLLCLKRWLIDMEAAVPAASCLQFSWSSWFLWRWFFPCLIFSSPLWRPMTVCICCIQQVHLLYPTGAFFCSHLPGVYINVPSGVVPVCILEAMIVRLKQAQQKRCSVLNPFGTLSSPSALRTCPSHQKCRCPRSDCMFVIPVCLRSWVFGAISVQKIHEDAYGIGRVFSRVWSTKSMIYSHLQPMLRIHNCCKLAFWCALDSVASTLPGSKETLIAMVDQRFANPRTTVLLMLIEDSSTSLVPSFLTSSGWL